MRKNKLLFLASMVLALAFTGCGGYEGEVVEGEEVTDSTDTEAEVEVDTTASGVEGGTYGDGYTNRIWVCSAGLPGWGPLFYARSCELSQAMDYAVALCERRMHVDGECFQQGCTLEYTHNRCYR